MSAVPPIKPVLVPVIVFAVSFGVGFGFIGMSQAIRINETQLERQQLLAKVRSEIEYHLTKTIAPTEILAYEVMRSGGHVKYFDEVAKGILGDTSGITNLQLAPEGVVEDIYPLEGHYAIIGHNLLVDERRSADAFATVESGKLTVAGPMTLAQGGVAIIARKPVYLHTDGMKKVINQSPDDERAPFWGFVSALIMLPEILDSPTLNSLQGLGYSYKFSRFDSSKQEHVSFAESGELLEPWAETIDITVPNARWTLAIGTDKAIGVVPFVVPLSVLITFCMMLAAFAFSAIRKSANTQP